MEIATKHKLSYLLLFLSFAFPIQYATAQEDNPITKYRRSSLSIILMEEEQMPKKELIVKAFLSIPMPDKYNNHNVAHRLFDPASMCVTQADINLFNIAKQDAEVTKKSGFGQFMKAAAIVVVAESTGKENNAMFDNVKQEEYEVRAFKFVREEQIAKALFDKWFLDDSSQFSMDLVKERGLYDASQIDIQTAQSSVRGMAMLEDAGEELINNTFVVVSRFRYISKAELIQEISATAGALAGESAASLSSATLNLSMGAGYYIRSTSFLFQLCWDEEIAHTLYSDLWDNIEAYNHADIFSLKYIGTETAFGNVKEGIFTKKSEEELIEIATINATDAVLAKLESKYDVFKTKTPIISIEPITAAIGLKEGIKGGDKFELLEQIQDEKSGKTSYKRVGTVKVSKDQIWDNRYMAAEELELQGKSQDFNVTKFDGKVRNIYPGMLLRKIK